MFLKAYRVGWILVAGILMVSCSEYQKVLKDSSETAKKYEMAERLYNEGDFRKANRLLEQIAPKYVGKPQGERVMFFLADSYYKIGDFNFAGYQFERFLKSYPRSDKAPEAGFLGAKSYYMLSPKYSLDQTDTDKALSKLQTFINTYPDSEFLTEANAMAQELTVKKQKKAFEIAKQFVKLGKHYTLNYNISAITALDNFISDHPGSPFREEAYFLKLRASTNLAMNSTADRKEERLQDAVAAYNAFKRYYPESEYGEDAVDLYEDIQKEMSDFQETETLSK